MGLHKGPVRAAAQQVHFGEIDIAIAAAIREIKENLGTQIKAEEVQRIEGPKVLAGVVLDYQSRCLRGDCYKAETMEQQNIVAIFSITMMLKEPTNRNIGDVADDHEGNVLGRGPQVAIDDRWIFQVRVHKNADLLPADRLQERWMLLFF
jgi:hypothetical protein